MAKTNKLAVTLVRSPIGRQPSHKATVVGLGLTRMHKTVIVNDTPSVRGMLDKVSYLLSVQPVKE
jgi:large subunit ribosomal protein L30